MDQYLGSNKLATYLHPNSTDPFLDLKSESIKSPSSDLIDICAFNSFDQRLIEPSLSSNTSSNKSFISSSDLDSRMAPISQIDYSNHSNEMNFISSSNCEENDCKTNISTTSSSSPKVKHIVKQNSSFDQYISNDFPKIILNKEECFLTSYQNDNDITSNYQLSSKKKNFFKNSLDFFK
jgi:hypothetical protein